MEFFAQVMKFWKGRKTTSMASATLNREYKSRESFLRDVKNGRLERIVNLILDVTCALPHLDVLLWYKNDKYVFVNIIVARLVLYQGDRVHFVDIGRSLRGR